MPTYQEDTAALNEYVTNYRDSNVWNKTNLKGEIGKSIITVGDFPRRNLKKKKKTR
jgi:hypothetical protein